MSDSNLPSVQGDDFFQQLGSELPAVEGADAEALKAFEEEGMTEEMKGFTLEYPRIEILHQGTAKWNFPSEDAVISSFVGVIVHIEASRVWWPWKFGKAPEGAGDDGWPHCYSRDLFKPDENARDSQASECSSCPKNEWGSDTTEDGSPARGKSCKEVRRLFVIPEERLMPHWIAISPSNLKPLKKYLTSLGNQKIARPQLVTTNFKLKTVENKDNIKYSELDLSLGKELPDALVLQVKNFRDEIKAAVERAAPVSQSEYQAGN